jgi:hypothetical protein
VLLVSVTWVFGSVSDFGFRSTPVHSCFGFGLSCHVRAGIWPPQSGAPVPRTGARQSNEFLRAWIRSSFVIRLCCHWISSQSRFPRAQRARSVFSCLDLVSHRARCCLGLCCSWCFVYCFDSCPQDWSLHSISVFSLLRPAFPAG